MSMPFNYFNATTYHLATKVHNLDLDTLKVALSNTAPDAADVILADITQIAAGNGYSAGGETITSSEVILTGSTASLEGDNVVFTAAGASMAAFRYLVVYNADAPNDELLGWWDFGSEVILPAGATFTLDLTAGILQVTHP